MELSVFGDESSDEARQRVFAISGVFGTASEWERADHGWNALTLGEAFHAADWERAGRKDEYKALAQFLAAGPVAGVVYALDLAAFNECYPGHIARSGLPEVLHSGGVSDRRQCRPLQRAEPEKNHQSQVYLRPAAGDEFQRLSGLRDSPQ